MPRLRDEITNTLRRLGKLNPSVPSISQKDNSADPDETLLATDPREGRQYASYRILRRLGTGGMGHVYLAQDTRLGRHAALKFLSPKLKSNPEMLVRLKQEARTASALNHPNILTIYDIDEGSGETFIASEYVEGITLRHALESGVATPASALDIAIQIASALNAAHEAGVVHRDLKPGNVMLRPDGLVKVIDFGLAKLQPQGRVAPLYEPLSDPDAIAGTVQYMSPEQARGDEVDHRTDLWSLGVILYEMVALQKPFDGETESHIVVAILDHRSPELKPCPGVPRGLARIVDKALTKNADQRYRSASEMLSALKSLNPHSQTRLPKVRSTPKRKWPWISLASVVLLTVLAIWWFRFDGREIILGPDWFEPTSYTQVTHRGDVLMASLSPDGKHVAYLTEKSGQQQVHLLNIETKSEWAWPAYTGNTMGIRFSPQNSSQIYITVHDTHELGKLYVAKEHSSAFTLVLQNIDGPIAFSPDGQEFAFRRRQEDNDNSKEQVILARTNDTGDQRTIITKYDTQVGPRISWSRDNVLALNLQKVDVNGNTHTTVSLFTPQGEPLDEFRDPPLRQLSGPAWISSHSALIFSGYGRETNGSQTILELQRRSGHFRIFPSPPLAAQGLTVSDDFKSVAALGSTGKSELFVAESNALDLPRQWAAGSFLYSLTWNSNGSVVYPSPRFDSQALVESKVDGTSNFVAQGNNCMRREPAAVPHSSLVLFSSNCEAGANESNLWLVDTAIGTATQLTENSRSDEWPTVSSDADTVLYNSFQNNSPVLIKMSLRAKSRSQFTPMQARNATISPDGQHVVCQVREHVDGAWRFAVLSMGDGAIEKDNLPIPVQASSLAKWSPDGSALDYVNAVDGANIWRLILDKLTARPLTHLHGSHITSFAWNPNGTRLAWIASDIHQDVIVFNRRSK